MRLPITTVATLIAAGSALVGCTPTGGLTPSAQGNITTAFNMICPNLAALAPVASSMNSKAQSAYASASAICVSGAPTNMSVVGLNLVAIMNSGVLQPYLSKIRIGG